MAPFLRIPATALRFTVSVNRLPEESLSENRLHAMSDSVIAALVGLASAVALELLRHLLMLGHKAAERSADDATAFRQDLLLRLNALEDDNATLVKERDEWQGRYYSEREQRARAEWQLEALGRKNASESVNSEGANSEGANKAHGTNSQSPNAHEEDSQKGNPQNTN